MVVTSGCDRKPLEFSTKKEIHYTKMYLPLIQFFEILHISKFSHVNWCDFFVTMESLHIPFNFSILSQVKKYVTKQGYATYAI